MGNGRLACLRKKQSVSFVLEAPRCRRCLFVRKRCGMNAELEQAWFDLVADGSSPEPRGRDTYRQHAGWLPGIRLHIIFRSRRQAAIKNTVG